MSTRIAVCIALLLAAAGPVSASTIGISGTTLIFGADLNEQLALSAFTSATDLFLEGATPEIVTPGCVADGATGVRSLRFRRSRSSGVIWTTPSR